MNALRPDDWRRVRDVFDRAVAVPPAERAQFVADACAADETWHAGVRALLVAHERAAGFLEGGCLATFSGWLDEDLSGAQLGPYRLESRVGGGGMGEVYRARDTRLGRPVAVKVLLSDVAVDEPARDRFEFEARAAATLNHPHICTVYDVGTHDGPPDRRSVPYLVMEFLEGDTLADRLAKGPCSVEEALEYAIQIASALDTAHRAGIVHRDLKPRNVMLTAGGAKLLDFGVAKADASHATRVTHAMDARVHESDLTSPGTIVGTVPYMAPEQLEGHPTDARTDLFGLGCVLYEMLTGHKAFAGRIGVTEIAAIIAVEPMPLRAVVPSIPGVVEDIVARCLARRADERWSSAADLLTSLKQAAGSVRSTTVPGRFRRWIWGHRAASALVLAGLILPAGAAYYLTPARPVASASSASAVQLAVLPLRMVGEAGGDEHLGIGLADSIITRLAAFRQIGLRSTAAVVGYAQTTPDAAAVGKALDVGYVLYGTIQRRGDAYRINLQLVSTATGAVGWAHGYEVPRSSLTTLQETIAEEVAGALRVELPDSSRSPGTRRYSANAEAYNVYLRGRASLVNYNEKNMKAAIDDFERVLVIDPDYAPARAGLAIASAWYSVRYAYEAEAVTWGARAEREAKAALAADPSLAEATLAMAGAAGTVHGAFNWPIVIAEATRALAIDPALELGHVVRMRAFLHLGLFERVADEARQAYRLNPLGNVEIARLELTRSLFTGNYAGARDEALAQLARGADAPAIRNYLGLAQFYTGDVAGARATLAAVQRRGRPDVRSQAALAGVEAAAGDRAAARARAIAVEHGSYMDHHVAYSLAAAWAQLGDAGAAVTWLERAADTGWPCFPWVQRDPMLDPVRQSPEFVSLLERLRVRHEQTAARYRPKP
ncbi:MAG TPA: protein kinase [Vicinamibacterales bacterium]|nr:protein kinase [Vicinamibacterales bacterium]